MNTDQLKQALELRFDSDAGDNLTIRDYFYTLLTAVWNEGESFSGKRPFGNGGWEYDLYRPLVKAGFVRGTLGDYGTLVEVDKIAAHSAVIELMHFAFYGKIPV